MRRLRLKLILLFRSVPEDSIKLQELLETFGVIERFTPYDQSGRGALRTEEARKWLEDRRHEALAEFALLISMVAMLAAVVAMIAAISAGVQESEYFISPP